MMNDYRPCIVKINEIKRKYRTKEGLIKNETVTEHEEHKALFHRWGEIHWTVGESIMVGGRAGGQMSEIVGIVEYEDGSMHSCAVDQITFTDGKVKKKWELYQE